MKFHIVELLTQLKRNSLSEKQRPMRAIEKLCRLRIEQKDYDISHEIPCSIKFIMLFLIGAILTLQIFERLSKLNRSSEGLETS